MPMRRCSRGAFGRESFGLVQPWQDLLPLLLTPYPLAFAVAAKAGACTVGVEGEVFFGRYPQLAYYRHQQDLHFRKPALSVACIVGGYGGSTLPWAFYFRRFLRAYYNVKMKYVPPF